MAEKPEPDRCDQLCVRDGAVTLCDVPLPPNRLCPNSKKHVQ